MLKELIGKILINIEDLDGEELVFICSDGSKYAMYHSQECCESVRVEDIIGDLEDLLHSELLVAEERSESGDTDYGSYTYTFYEFATIKGSVTIRWYGTSNGYYSERVNFKKI